MIPRLLSAIAAACLLFATGANAQGKAEWLVRSIQLENGFKIHQMGSAT